MNVSIEKALPNQARSVSELALRSKAHWGYSEQLLQAMKVELTYTSEDLKTHPTYLVLVDGEMAGFYQLVKINPSIFELEALFVEPEMIGQGLGTYLFSHAVTQAKDMGCQKLSIQSDPFAAFFYSKQGCTQVGELASLSIPSRMLPLFSFDLNKQ